MYNQHDYLWGIFRCSLSETLPPLTLTFNITLPRSWLVWNARHWVNRRNPQVIQTWQGRHYCSGCCSLSDSTLLTRRLTRADLCDSNSSSCNNSSIIRHGWHSVDTRDFRVTMQFNWDKIVVALSTSWKVKAALWADGMEWYMNGSFVQRVSRSFSLKQRISISWWCSLLKVGTRIDSEQ